ncbi:hypothetical protein N7457_002568 [Penicillium paradoxum]|uniref:uncharacterized protein n=1 Tax=Penicillium paradoxum TaxID=176176 RepID=UPI002546C0D1|nr:uncharacterized protein N7457_002568 [Penicillium paradoxum]KAJ5787578.1 hypothetical protein N7457_002568 [Penicillium paradoxum]
MRFLCLHGGGTNREIFEIQTGGLRQQLEKHGHRFEFMNGKMSAKVEEGKIAIYIHDPADINPANVHRNTELEGVVDGPFYNHYSRGAYPASSVLDAFDHTQRFIAEHGPFDAVMGFSQGAALAASLIIHHNRTRPAEPPLFRAAVFICGAAPWESSGQQQIEPKPDTYPIAIPTANIVGKADPLFPESQKLYELCEPAKAAYYDHGSKHMVPFDMKNTEEMTRAIQETVAKAIRG